MDKEAMNILLDGTGLPQDSPVWLVFDDYYKDNWKIHYDYPKARDLMREENYWASDSNEFVFGKQAIPIQTITTKTAGIDKLFLISAIGILVVSLKKHKKLAK